MIIMIDYNTCNYAERGGNMAEKEKMIGVEGIFTVRSTWQEAQVRPQLLKEATGNQIVRALEVAVSALNATGVVRRKESKFFKMGEVQFAEDISDDGTCVGTSGKYPSANMALLVDENPLISPEKAYPAGTQICIVHCFWDKNECTNEHSLPMLREIYRTIRRKFVVLIEEQLRLSEERN